MLSHSHNDHLVSLLEREMSRPVHSEADEPYARALRIVLAELDETEKSTHELFTYYLRRLERQGRGNEPFARAIREALASNDTSRLTALLRGRMKDEGGRE